jgi:transcriptional/translational regulatory protein YebC/TACO1
VQDALREKGIVWEEAALEMVPKTEVRVEGESAQQLAKLLDLLEDMDDVQKVYTNGDLDIDLAEV